MLFTLIAKPAGNRVYELDEVNRVCELDEVNRVVELMFLNIFYETIHC